ncbi:hypothetical protein DRQ33_07905, partial [bacterium]
GTTADDGTTSVALPFIFRFYGVDYNRIYINVNGVLTFRNQYDQWWMPDLNFPIPFDGIPNAILAPLWDDLELTNESDGIYYWANADTVIIQYHNIHQSGGGTDYDFEVLLINPEVTGDYNGNGEVIFKYVDIDVPGLSSAVIGIENADGSEGLEYLSYGIYGTAPEIILGAADLTVVPSAVKFTTVPSVFPPDSEWYNLVTHDWEMGPQQPFDVHVRVCYNASADWQVDSLESLMVYIENGYTDTCYLAGPDFYVLYPGDFMPDGDLYCTTVSYPYYAQDWNVCDERDIEDWFRTDFAWVHFDNWNFNEFTSGSKELVDANAFVSILEPPQLDITDATIAGYQGTYTGTYWINSWNTLEITVFFYNMLSTCSDWGRATADRLDTYPMPLTIFDPYWTDVGTGITGLDAPLIRPDTLFPGQDSLVYYEIGWDGVTAVYEGYVDYMIDTLWFHDKNWPTQDWPEPWLQVDTNASGFPIYISPEMDTVSKFFLFSIGIDVTMPVVDIIHPPADNYSAGTWPDSGRIIATDNFSGVIANTVM